MKKLKYFTVKDYEDLKAFLRRVKYEMGHLDYSYISCSDTIGKGVQVLLLISKTNINDQIKLEVYEGDMPELKKQFEITKVNTKPLKGKKDAFSNTVFGTGIRDLY